jgi:hypothetical protein
MIATLGGLTFSGDQDDATYRISPDGFRGWFDGVEVRRDRVQRPTADGEFPSPGYLGARVITISGHVLADNAVDFENALNALATLLDDGSMSDLVVEQATGTFSIEVGRIGAPDIIIQSYGAVARYQLQLWAPDPTITEVTP